MLLWVPQHDQKSEIMADDFPRRLAPDERKLKLLNTAVDLLRQKGLDGFSLEAVARDAGVALSLPRHYFGSTRDLLRAATEDLLSDIEDVLFLRETRQSLVERFTTYLDLLAKNPWGHQVWMQSNDVHEEVHAIVQKARRRMSESIYRKTWREMSKREQFDARGRIGYVEALVSDWIDRGYADRDMVVSLIIQAITLPHDSRTNEKPVRRSVAV